MSRSQPPNELAATAKRYFIYRNPVNFHGHFKQNSQLIRSSSRALPRTLQKKPSIQDRRDIRAESQGTVT
jgi:hypothetical protein